MGVSGLQTITNIILEQVEPVESFEFNLHVLQQHLASELH